MSIWAIIIVFLINQYFSQETNNSQKNDIVFDLYLIFVPTSLLFAFWIFDGFFKNFQRYSIVRSQAIQDYLNHSLNELSNIEHTKFDEEMKKQQKLKEKLNDLENKLEKKRQEQKKKP